MAVYEGHSSAKRIKTDYDYYYYHQGTEGRSDHRVKDGNYRNDERENHVLLITVINPAYSITCDIIHQICNPHGKVLRVVIFKKNGVQAMVEFDCVESAKRAKQELHGCDIYSGCCTLRIEFAKPTRLNVYKNDNESFDFTNPMLSKPAERPALLGEPTAGLVNNWSSITVPPHSGNFPPDHGQDGFHDGYGAGPRPPQPPPPTQQSYIDPYLQHPPGDLYRDNRGSVFPAPPDIPVYRGAPSQNQPPPPGGPPPMMAEGPPNPSGAPQQGAVMMVYGLDYDKMNADRLFNLFCLYGNVVRVKFLKSKEGCAMVQMGDQMAVDRCIQSLNNLTFFGKKMQLSYSKQAFLNDVQQPFELPDGTPSFKDFMGNRNNRFTNPEAAGKNRIAPSAKVLHFFNAPHGMTEEEIMDIFKNYSTAIPTGVKLFQSKTERSSSGLIQFDSVSEAVEALVYCNHVSIPNPSGKFPFVFKLCFSSTGSRF